MTLTITNPQSSYPYGSAVDVQATIQLATPLGPGENPIGGGIYVHVSNGGSYQVNWVSNSADGLTFTYAGDIGYGDPGGFTANTSYENPDTHITTTSNTISFTVVKGPSTDGCTPPPPNPVVVGTSFQVDVSLNGNTVVTSENFTLSLSGPVTTPPVTLNTNGSSVLTMTAPTTTGTYSLICTFDGNARYNGSSVTIPNAVIVKGNAHIAGIRLYTNPTTVRLGVVLTFYIVLLPAPGGPTPTGSIAISLGDPVKYGYFSYQPVSVGANGDTLVQLDPLPVYGSVPISPITISYSGDLHYLSSGATFTLTNPPIPGSAPHSGTTVGSKGGKSGGSATPTTTTGTPTPTVEPSPTATVIASPTPTPSTALSDTFAGVPAPLLWLTGGLGALIVLGAAAGLLFYLRKRGLSPFVQRKQGLVEMSRSDVSSPPDPPPAPPEAPPLGERLDE
jgi:hypothetical protein